MSRSSDFNADRQTKPIALPLAHVHGVNTYIVGTELSCQYFHEYHLIVFDIYRIAGNFGRELNLVVWWSTSQPPK